MVYLFLRKKRAITAGLAFTLSLIMTLAVYIIKGISPFGDKCLIAMDAWGQYFPMLWERRNNFSDWSFSGGLGFDMISQSAYYTNSPLWIILYFVPRKNMIAAVDLITALRFGLSGLTFCVWITKGKSNVKLSAAFFSCAYSISAYSLAFINQFMWMDAVILLPVIINGMDNISKSKTPFLYIISLAVMLYSNFYIGYMICVFCVMGLIYLCFRVRISWKKRFKLSAEFFGSSLLAGGLSAFVLLPTFADLKLTIAMENGRCNFNVFYHGILQTFKKFLPFQPVSLAYEEANIYCGIICALLVLAYPFIVKNSRKSILLFAAVIFLLISFNFSGLDYFWHGFHFPNQLPARQSFLLCFIIVSMAYKAFLNIPKKQKPFFCVIPFLLFAEIFANAFFTVNTQTWLSSESFYLRHDKLIAGERPENDFYRTEFITPDNHNAGQLYSFNGISHYSSLMSSAEYEFFRKLGMDIYAENVSSCYLPSNILNAVFGVKYLIAENGEKPELYGLKDIFSDGDITVYQNKYALPIAFAASSEILNIDMESCNGEKLQKKIFSALCGNKVNMESESDFALNIESLKREGLYDISTYSGEITGKIEVFEPGVLFLSLPYESGWNVYIDGEKTEKFSILDYLMGVNIREGSHSVKIRRENTFLNMGLIITGTSAAIIFILLRCKN